MINVGQGGADIKIEDNIENQNFGDDEDGASPSNFDDDENDEERDDEDSLHNFNLQPVAQPPQDRLMRHSNKRGKL